MGAIGAMGALGAVGEESEHMAVLHEERYKADILRRVESLRPDSRGQWGKMSVGQMLWHVNQAMEGCAGAHPGDA